MAGLYSDDPEKQREMLTWPDDVLGKFILGRSIQFVAEMKGVNAEEIGNAYVDALRTVPTLDVGDVALEKVLRLAALGEFDAAGRNFRRLLINHGVSYINKGLAELGRKFKTGRKLGTGGLIRKAIAGRLEKSPALKNPELWDVIGSKPPKGWSFFDNRTGKYIEGPRMANGEYANMNYERFCTVCGEERNKVKGKNTG